MKIVNYLYTVLMLSLTLACNTKTKESSVVCLDEEPQFIQEKLLPVSDSLGEENDFEDIDTNVKRYISADKRYELSIEEVPSEEYTSLYKKHKRHEKRAVAIYAEDSIFIELAKYGVYIDEKREYEEILSIVLTRKNGEVIKDLYEGQIIAYFPEYHFLYLEGLIAETGVNILTGKQLGEIGNPDTQTFSPTNKFRISNRHDGQDCSLLMIEEVNDKGFLLLSSLADACYIRDSFWSDDYTFYYESLGYFRLAIESIQD